MHQPAFPLLDGALVQEVISQGQARRAQNAPYSDRSTGGGASNSSHFNLVPMGQRQEGGSGGAGSHLTNSARRL
ncbi:MAG: hypothetical protein ACK56I_01900, partial [bacterium]